MSLGIDFLNDVGRSWGARWDQVGIKIDPTSMWTSKNDVFQKTCFSFLEKLTFWRIKGSKLGAQVDQKSILKWCRKKTSSWHRFFIDFGRFGEASWDGKSRQLGSDEVRSGQILETKSSQIRHVISSSVWCEVGAAPGWSWRGCPV